VRDGKTIPVSGYTKTTRTGSEAAVGVMDVRGVYREFDEGATIVFQGMHRYWEPLALFCRRLELGLGHPVQANAYVTPPGSQGFDAHEDEHDVFVLQSHGSKKWQVNERHDLPPSRPPLIDAVIAPGDSLYIPTGFPHSASTQQDASVHITVGILAITWSAVLDEAVKLAKTDLLLDEPLPLGFAGSPDELAQVVQDRLTELGALIGKTDAPVVAARLRSRFLTTRQSVLRGQMHQILGLGAVTDDSKVRRRAGAISVIDRVGEEVALRLGDRELRMPGRLAPVLADIVGRDRFVVADLASHLDEEGRLVLIRRLIKEGLLEVAE
jgi:ribosomal protein L16 Arg81 hydroxylase